MQYKKEKNVTSNKWMQTLTSSAVIAVSHVIWTIRSWSEIQIFCNTRRFSSINGGHLLWGGNEVVVPAKEKSEIESKNKTTLL